MKSLLEQSTNPETDMAQLISSISNSEGISNAEIKYSSDKEWEDEDYSLIAYRPKLDECNLNV